MKISIVMPAHNEEKIIVKTLYNLKKDLKVKDYEIVVVNDHSIDKTFNIVKKITTTNKKIKIVNNPNPGGFGNAIKYGIKVAKGDAIVFVMADLCDDVKTINKMAELISGHDVVVGSRYMKGGKLFTHQLVKGLMSRNYDGFLRFFVGVPTHDATNAFKMYRADVLKNMKLKNSDFSISVEMLLKAFFNKKKITETPTIWKDRIEGESKFRIFEQGRPYLRLLIKGIACRLFNLEL